MLTPIGGGVVTTTVTATTQMQVVAVRWSPAIIALAVAIVRKASATGFAKVRS